MPDLRKLVQSSGLSDAGHQKLADLQADIQFNHDMPPEVFLPLAGRASNVVGRILDEISENRPKFPLPMKWLTRILRLFWGLVEIAIPRSMANVVAHHWLRLLYLFEALMIAGGLVLVSESVQKFGVTALAYTLALHAAVLILKDVMLHRQIWLGSVAAAAILFFTVTTLLGIITLLAAFRIGSTPAFVARLLQAQEVGANFTTFARAMALFAFGSIIAVTRVADGMTSPNKRSPRYDQWVFGGFALLFGVAMIGVHIYSYGDEINNGIRKPMLALELVKSKADFDTVLAAKDVTRADLEKGLRLDEFVVSPLYGLFFVALAGRLARPDKKWTLVPAYLGGVCAILAAIFDEVENVASMRALALNITPERLNELVTSIHFASDTKWLLLGVAMLAVGALFFALKPQWRVTPGIPYVLTGVLILAGVWLNALLNWAILGIGISVIATSITFFFAVRKGVV